MTKDEIIDQLWERSSHGTRREDVVRAYEAGAAAAKPPRGGRPRNSKKPPQVSVETKTNLAINIGRQRRAAGLTQAQLAEKLGLNVLTVSRYETARINPPITVIERIAQLLKTTMMQLMFAPNEIDAHGGKAMP